MKKALLFSLLFVILDQIAKFIVVKTMEVGESIKVIQNVFYITSVRNPNAGLGGFNFAGNMYVFYAITIVALFIFYYFLKDIDFQHKKLYTYAIILLIAGTLGNFIDRLLFQEVVDFLDFYIFGFNFWVFNIADMCLDIGIVMLAIDLLFLEPKRKKITHE